MTIICQECNKPVKVTMYDLLLRNHFRCKYCTCKNYHKHIKALQVLSFFYLLLGLVSLALTLKYLYYNEYKIIIAFLAYIATLIILYPLYKLLAVCIYNRACKIPQTPKDKP